jgi:pSer/pThr/pTyr-binding forkhead associated (FHA) protein
MGGDTGAAFQLLACDPSAVRPDRYLLEGDRCVIGRHESCAVVIAERPGVSRQHAVVERERPGSLYYLLTDNGSSYGTYVNGRRLEPGGRHRLCHDDAIGLGAEEPLLRVVDLDVTGRPAAAAPPPRQLYLDEQHLTFYLRGAPLRLTRSEERLLAHLYRHRGHVCRIESCVEAIWYDEATHDDSRRKGLHTLVSGLRKTLQGEGWTAPILNYREIGYELNLPDR